MHVMQAHILTITHPLRHQSVEAPASPIPKVSMALDHGRPLKFSHAPQFPTSKLSYMSVLGIGGDMVQILKLCM